MSPLVLAQWGMQCVCFFSAVVTVELTDCENAPTRGHEGLRALGMRGNHAKKKPMRTRAGRSNKSHFILHIFWVPAGSKIVSDVWPSSHSFETEQALRSVVSACSHMKFVFPLRF